MDRYNSPWLGKLNPGFGGNNYLLNWGTAPRSLVFIGGFLWVSVVYAALLSGFGVLWWVSVMLVSFLLGFGVFFDGVWCFVGVPRCFKPLCSVERIFRSMNQNVELFYSLNSKAPNNYLN